MATAFFRTVILYLLLIAGLRLSGKRQIGELEPIELVLTLLISDLASVPMQDFALPLFNGVIPIITLIALSTLFSAISLRNVRFRDLVCGQPALVIVDGKLRQETMRRNRLTLVRAAAGPGDHRLERRKVRRAGDERPSVRAAPQSASAGHAGAAGAGRTGQRIPAHHPHQRRPGADG